MNTNDIALQTLPFIVIIVENRSPRPISMQTMPTKFILVGFKASNSIISKRKNNIK